MKPEPERLCPSCGYKLSSATTVCPVCLLRRALTAGDFGSGEPAFSDAIVEPAPERSARRFGHYELVTNVPRYAIS